MAEGADAVQHDPRRRAKMARKRQRGTAARKVVLQFHLATMKSFQAWGRWISGGLNVLTLFLGNLTEAKLISVPV